MKNYSFYTLAVLFSFFLFFLGGEVLAQNFSLDDNPSAPLTAPLVLPLLSAEDPYGVFGPPRLGPSPMLGNLWDSDILLFGPVLDIRLLPTYSYMNGVSGNHDVFGAGNFAFRFSVDRETPGVPGNASHTQFFRNQNSADIFDGTAFFPHPGFFVPLGLGPYAGVLPSAGVGGGNFLFINQDVLGLVPLIPPGMVGPVVGVGTHDNIDAFNDIPAMSLTGFDFYFTVPPAEAFLSGALSSDIYGGSTTGGIYATAAMMGLDIFGAPGSDDIDGLVVFDHNLHLPNTAEPVVDFALFTLAPRSSTLIKLVSMGVMADPATIFLTDFSGAFAIFAFAGDLGLVHRPTIPYNNVDALEIR